MNVANVQDIRLPYYSGCEETVAKARRFFRDKSLGKDYKLVLSISEFDINTAASDQVKGQVTLALEGEWITVNGITSELYLTALANSIRAECMPYNFKTTALNDAFFDYQELSKGGLVIPRFYEGEFVLFYNDGSYKNNNWEKY